MPPYCPSVFSPAPALRQARSGLEVVPALQVPKPKLAALSPVTLYVVWPFLAALSVRFPNRNALRCEPQLPLAARGLLQVAVLMAAYCTSAPTP